jgi:DNA invertase Pin-like site-specific DNA recombinase
LVLLVSSCLIPKERHGQELSTGVRRKVLDLLDAGGSVAQIAQDLGITGQTIYNLSEAVSARQRTMRRGDRHVRTLRRAVARRRRVS